MHLADFIIQEMETILVEWESFAGTCTTRGAKMSSLALRDHAKQILEAIASDLRRFQTEEGQTREGQTREGQGRKSKRRAPGVQNAVGTAAQVHADLREKSGFDITQLVSEYRALRSSVSHLWLAACQPGTAGIEDLVRFHEAIDQAVAESVEFFDDKIEQARHVLLGTLGHDLCAPLQAIKLTAAYLQELKAGPEISRAASLVDRSVESIQSLLNDLVDFSRTRVGLGISIKCTDIDLKTLFQDEVGRLRRAHLDQTLEIQFSGNLHGRWDDRRLQQLLNKLVINAIAYGEKGKPVRIVVAGDDAELSFEVLNQGPVIEPSILERIFEPRARALQESSPCDGSLGLGLFIAREIAVAHAGSICARSCPAETVFSVRLPRQAIASLTP